MNQWFRVRKGNRLLVLDSFALASSEQKGQDIRWYVFYDSHRICHVVLKGVKGEAA